MKVIFAHLAKYGPYVHRMCINIVCCIMIGTSGHFRFEKNVLPGHLGIGSMCISISYVSGGVFAQLRVFSRTALCNSVETHVAYIFYLVYF